ncbi:MAG: hypothetical protein R3F65_32805 [bacterium]
MLEREGPIARLEPLADPDGATAPYLFTARFGTARSIQLAHGGAYIEPGGGATAASRYFAAIGFGQTRALSRQLAGVLLNHFGLLDGGYHGATHTWAMHDAHYTDEELPLPTYTCAESGCTYTADAIVSDDGPTSAGVPREHHRQRRITITPDGKVTAQTVDAE